MAAEKGPHTHTASLEKGRSRRVEENNLTSVVGGRVEGPPASRLGVVESGRDPFGRAVPQWVVCLGLVGDGIEYVIPMDAWRSPSRARSP